jgi:hypothetical protein
VLMRQALTERTLKVQWDHGNDGIFSDVDAFLELSKGNNIVEEVQVNPYWYENSIRLSDAEWEEKLGRALGNLQSLKVLRIEYGDDSVYEEEEPPDWETVARVLRHVRQKITLSVPYLRTRGSEKAFARAIRGHPTIQRLETEGSFHFESFGIITSALATLSALETAFLGHTVLEDNELQPEHLEDLPAIEHPEHITTLLLSPSLRSVEFKSFCFQNSVCQAVALALRTGSPITSLELTRCGFVDGAGERLCTLYTETRR